MTARDGARAHLAAIAGRPDEDIDLAAAALALSVLGAHAVDPEPYRRHLAEIADAVGLRAAVSLPERIDALNSVLFNAFGYHGDTLTYDDLDNADLARVIDRRKGLPVALGILYIHAARSQGWDAAGLNFPGHFLIRLERRGEAAVIDPFHAGQVLDAAGLRSLLKAMAGNDAELEPSHWQKVASRDVLIRLQNNIKTRCVRSGDVARALGAVEAMLLFAPDIAPLWRDAGMLNVTLGKLGAAVEALEGFVVRSAEGPARAEAERLLGSVRRRLN